MCDSRGSARCAGAGAGRRDASGVREATLVFSGSRGWYGVGAIPGEFVVAGLVPGGESFQRAMGIPAVIERWKVPSGPASNQCLRVQTRLPHARVHGRRTLRAGECSPIPVPKACRASHSAPRHHSLVRRAEPREPETRPPDRRRAPQFHEGGAALPRAGGPERVRARRGEPACPVVRLDAGLRTGTGGCPERSIAG